MTPALTHACIRRGRYTKEIILSLVLVFSNFTVLKCFPELIQEFSNGKTFQIGYLFFHCLETADHWGLELELGI